MNDSRLTWASLGAVLGMVISAVAGSWYVQTAIADEGKAARAFASELSHENKTQMAEIYARREDVRELQTKLDMVIALQKRIIEKLDN